MELRLRRAADGQGLANLYGGRAQLAAKLDQLFTTPENGDGRRSRVPRERGCALRRVGDRDEPAFHIPYMYDYAGEPYKAQAIMRAAENRLFVGSDIGEGYTGDDDSGATVVVAGLRRVGAVSVAGG